MNSNNSIHIIADYSENPSGIPDLLLKKGASLKLEQLKVGDYIINNDITVERKSAEDFIQSIISGRLFKQCAQLSKIRLRPLLLLEGNPFLTAHDIDKNAIKGAMLSVAASWQIPLVYSKNADDSATQILMLAKQSLQQPPFLRYNVFKPKRIKNHKLRFLQGLPCVGAVTASRLLAHFSTLEAIMAAKENDLQEVMGIGGKMAKKIRNFLST